MVQYQRYINSLAEMIYLFPMCRACPFRGNFRTYFLNLSVCQTNTTATCSKLTSLIFPQSPSWVVNFTKLFLIWSMTYIRNRLMKSGSSSRSLLSPFASWKAFQFVSNDLHARSINSFVDLFSITLFLDIINPHFYMIIWRSFYLVPVWGQGKYYLL